MACKRCAGSGIDALGNPCTECDAAKDVLYVATPWIPLQYQGNRYSASALPLHMAEWGADMETIRNDIVARTDLKNYLICSPFRTGKTVWAYDILERLAQVGHPVTTITDLDEIKRLLYSYKEKDMDTLSLVLTVPVLIVRIPPLLQAGFGEVMQTILYKRLSTNGQTIFLYSDSYYNLEENIGSKRHLQSMLGDGSLGSIKLKNYRRSKDVELEN